MLRDSEASQQVTQSWNGAAALREKIQGSVMSTFAIPGFVSPLLSDAAYNLPFMHASAVLADALQALAHQHDHAYKGRELGRLFTECRYKLDWSDFDLVAEGKQLRDAVAHRGELVPRGDCWKYIDAIEVELVNWGVIESAETS